MNSFTIFLLLFLSINCIDESEINCEAIVSSTWPSLNDKLLNSCSCRFYVSISDTNVKISNSDSSLHGLSFYKNRDIFYLPVDVAKSFPNLIAYDASETSVKEIYKDNFRKLRNLRSLSLRRNTI